MCVHVFMFVCVCAHPFLILPDRLSHAPGQSLDCPYSSRSYRKEMMTNNKQVHLRMGESKLKVHMYALSL